MSGSIRGPDGISRLSGSVILLLDSTNTQRARALSSERGEFALQAPAPGRYSLRVLRIGFRPSTVAPFLLSRDTTITLSLELVPVRLPTVTTLERSVCRLASDAGLATAMLWDEAKIAIIASAITLEQQAYRFDAELHSRLYDMRRPPALLDVAIAEQRSQGARPWTSFSPDTLEQSGFAIEADGTILFVAPDLDVLLSPFFAAKHCLQVHRGPPPAPGLLGLDFAPAEAVPHVELRGTLWLNESSHELSSLSFWFVNLPLDASDTLAGGRVEFRRLATGSWVLPRWSIRAPVPAKPVEGRPGPRVITPITGAHWRPLLANDPRWRAQRVRVVGGDLRSVRIADSAQSAPLLVGRTGSLSLTAFARAAGRDEPSDEAMVLLVGSTRRVIADSTGVASFPDLVEGDYLLEVSTPYYDALLLPPVRLAIPVRAESLSTQRVELQSLSRAAARLCGTDRSKTILVGTVRRDGLPVSGANVLAAFGADTTRRRFDEATSRAAKGTTKTDAEGRYRLCGAPRGVPIVVRATGAGGAAAERMIVVPRDDASPIVRADLAFSPSAPAQPPSARYRSREIHTLIDDRRTSRSVKSTTNNQWAIAIMLRPRILMQRAMVTVERLETLLRNRGMAWIHSRRGFVAYKMSTRVSLLEEIADALDRAGIPHCVTGGFAYDALRGAVTRYHADVDFALLGEHARAAIAALEARGLDVTSHSVFKAVAARGDLHADLFLWQDVGDGKVEMMLPSDTGIVEVQIPREFVSLSVQVELMGIRFRISGKQYMVSILPFVGDEKDRELISSLVAGAPLRFEESVGRVEMRTRRFEFRDGGGSPNLPDGPG